VLEEGVFEYEVAADRPELAVSLLRCVGTISRPDPMATRPGLAGPDIATPDGQMIGETRFALGLMSNARREDLLPAWERFALPLMRSETRGGGDLSPTGTLLEVKGAELSAIRRVDGEVEVRIWNPSDSSRRPSIGGREIELGPARIEAVRLPL
jgi:mannosylglycerate hydrolase